MSFVDDYQLAELFQKAVVSHKGEAYVEACPGAGKTLTLVHRVSGICEALAPRHGIAVLSFTNSAVDEFKDRCHREGTLSRFGHPHFIGTFDSFLNQFVVTPAGIPGCSKRPILVDNWDEIDITPGLRGVRAAPVKLSLFDAATSRIDPASIRHKGLAATVSAHQKRYETEAQKRRAALNSRGMICAADARLVVKKLLGQKTHADAVGEALAARFQEVIVDEAQDCNADDVEVLTWLRGHGIRLIMVCDPDQAIYQFRKGSADALKSFVADIPKLPMTGNFRSSRIICKTAATMRGRVQPDLAVGIHRDVDFPIHIIPYDKTAKSSIGSKFVDIANGLEVHPSNCIVLAHKRNLARQASGHPSFAASSSGKLARLAQAAVQFHAPAASGRQRETAVKVVIRVIMAIEGQPEADVAALRLLSVSTELNREYRRKAIEILCALPPSSSPEKLDHWMETARSIVEKTVTIGVAQTIKQCMAARGDWNQPLLSSQVIAPIQYATVHEAKGHDFDGVCLVLDSDSRQAIGDWANRDSACSEGLRVLYVGVTRAKKLLAIALPTNLVDQVKEILRSGDVSFT